MKALDDIVKQIRGLVYGIRECNFIQDDDRYDIIQESILKVLEKHNQGVLKDDAQDVRGYVFQIVRNACLTYHKKKTTSVPLSPNLTEDTKFCFEEDEHIQHQVEVIRANIFNKKFKPKHRQYFEYLIDGRSEEEIRELMCLTKMQLGSIKRGLAYKMSSLFKKPVRYKIYDTITGKLEYACYSMYDVHLYLPQFSHRQIQYSIEKNRNLNEYKIIKL